MYIVWDKKTLFETRRKMSVLACRIWMHKMYSYTNEHTKSKVQHIVVYLLGATFKCNRVWLRTTQRSTVKVLVNVRASNSKIKKNGSKILKQKRDWILLSFSQPIELFCIHTLEWRFRWFYTGKKRQVHPHFEQH